MSRDSKIQAAIAQIHPAEHSGIDGTGFLLVAKGCVFMVHVYGKKPMTPQEIYDALVSAAAHVKGSSRDVR